MPSICPIKYKVAITRFPTRFFAEACTDKICWALHPASRFHVPFECLTSLTMSTRPTAQTYKHANCAAKLLSNRKPSLSSAFLEISAHEAVSLFRILIQRSKSYWLSLSTAMLKGFAGSLIRSEEQICLFILELDENRIKHVEDRVLTTPCLDTRLNLRSLSISNGGLSSLGATWVSQDGKPGFDDVLPNKRDIKRKPGSGVSMGAGVTNFKP